MNLRFQLIKYLANLNFAIILLLLIAIISATGAVVEQEQPIEFYKNNYDQVIYQNVSFGKLMLFFGIDHIFQTWWFNLLLFIFGISLLSCTFLQQLPTFKFSKACYFYSNPSQFYRYPIKTKIINVSNGILTFTVKKKYAFFQQKNMFYGYRGLAGRIAPIFVHLSMNLILLGSICGALTGFTSQEVVPKTEIFHIQNLLTLNLFNYVPQLPSRVNDFWINYKKKNAIDQFYSDLSILDNSGHELKRSTISVNHPLRYEGLNYYQTDWSIIGLRINYNNIVYQVPILSPGKLNKTLWFSWVPFDRDSRKEGVNLILNNLVGTQNLYNNKGEFVKNIDLGEPVSFAKKTKFKILDLVETTGLQIKYDPGLPIIYIGFTMLMATIITSYLSYFQIWILRRKNILFFAGETNRAKLTLEKETLNLILRFNK
jgi:cytochrome c biogenesis protein|tara:strand:+ start:2717 stop:4000 length:1284 start_codon:yes stop_codon:yes gene_type:complete